MAIVILSIAGIVLEEMESPFIPINPTIIRVMRVLRIARGRRTRMTICRLLLSDSMPSEDSVTFPVGMEEDRYFDGARSKASRHIVLLLKIWLVEGLCSFHHVRLVMHATKP